MYVIALWESEYSYHVHRYPGEYPCLGSAAYFLCVGEPRTLHAGLSKGKIMALTSRATLLRLEL